MRRFKHTSKKHQRKTANNVLETCTDPNWLTIAEFFMRWVVALIGWVVALWLWKLRREQARRMADHTEVNKAIDAALEQVGRFECLALQFWSDAESKILPEQISSGMAACTFYTMQIVHLSEEREYPSKALSDMRRAATLNMEQEKRGIDSQKERLGRFVKLVAKLRKSEVFRKRPFLG